MVCDGDYSASAVDTAGRRSNSRVVPGCSSRALARRIRLGRGGAAGRRCTGLHPEEL